MSHVLEAMERKDLKGSELKLLRKNGMVPAVIYGKKVDNVPITVDKALFLQGIKEVGKNGILSIDVSGRQHKVMLRQYEQDPITREITHIDFLAVDETSEVTAEARLVLVGDAIGVKEGGIMQQVIHDISITAPAIEIPEAVEVDVTNLKIGETIAIEQLKNQYSFTINHEDDEVIVSILPPKQEEIIHTGEKQSPAEPDDVEVSEDAE